MVSIDNRGVLTGEVQVSVQDVIIVVLSFISVILMAIGITRLNSGVQWER